jgi:TRAP-type uncharacterized transport system fused permease subunit
VSSAARLLSFDRVMATVHLFHNREPMPSKEGDRVRYSAAERVIALVAIPLLVGLLFVLDWLFGTNSVTRTVGALVFALVICCFVIAVVGSRPED